MGSEMCIRDRIRASISLECYSETCQDCGCGEVDVQIDDLSFWYGLRSKTKGRLFDPKPVNFSASNCNDSKGNLLCQDSIALALNRNKLIYGVKLDGNLNIRLYKDGN